MNENTLGGADYQLGRQHAEWALANLPHRTTGPRIADILRYGPDWTRGYQDRYAEGGADTGARHNARVCGDCWQLIRPTAFEPFSNVFRPCTRCGAYATVHVVSWDEVRNAAPAYDGADTCRHCGLPLAVHVWVSNEDCLVDDGATRPTSDTYMNARHPSACDCQQCESRFDDE